MSQSRVSAEERVAELATFAQQAAKALSDDNRVLAIWLTGSLATGSADAQSDVDLRVAIKAEAFSTIEQWWQELIDLVAPTVWKRRWPGPPEEAIIGAITSDYLRFDLVIQSASDTKPRTLEAAQLLFDKDNTARQIHLTASAQKQPLKQLAYIVEEFIRLLGMLPIVVERDDVPIGMEGQLAIHSMLISLLLMENGIDRAITGKRHVAIHLNEEQRATLNSVPPLEPTIESISQGRMAYARLFLPRARRLMEANGLQYPAAFEAATRQHLQDTLGLSW
ncbi:nucleotidyltransferase domain-containing protein [Dictyobacter aurantiacus]|uniref:Polymerase beta nucleotidyltransferase domain-containing protein n=1 Tax=Dictyobacter aurantiacus TaxID=1936993 RepID=A0A401ZIP7_9CHLR|nr:nucleotidyltransferase domain-containing protein [Dictyobacter aurantiacus]GCE06726.1 hypothetical protein KDAU_40550 [Dictyobacter aurantiacus]